MRRALFGGRRRSSAFATVLDNHDGEVDVEENGVALGSPSLTSLRRTDLSFPRSSRPTTTVAVTTSAFGRLRATSRRTDASTSAPRRRRRRRQSSKVEDDHRRRGRGGGVLPPLSVPTAVAAWYVLGAVSVSTSRLLLVEESGVGPVALSLQQFAFGALSLRGRGRAPSSRAPRPTATATAFWFAAGFACTNAAFSGHAPSFVETVKAAEPITSAAVAALGGAEILTRREATALTAVVSGVLLSTSASPTSGNGSFSSSSSWSRRDGVVVVLAANVCFSLRGLYQKRLRSAPGGGRDELDDVRLQYETQRIATLLCVVPALVLEAPRWIEQLGEFDLAAARPGLARYAVLSIVNGATFTAYNLASTYVLSRVSMVHHAALNCVRRIFAVVVTSLAFGIPLTLLGCLGVLVSALGFLDFARSRSGRRQRRRNKDDDGGQPLSDLLPASVV